MKAVVLHEYGPPENLKYEDFDDPTPGPGEVLVRVHGAGVNPIDWKRRSGATKAIVALDFPVILGFDFAGTVEEIGEGVSGFVKGDRVFGRTPGTYAELATAKAAEIAKVPEGLDLTIAAALPMVSTTAHQLIHEAVKAQSGQTILLTGALGSVGRCALYSALEIGVSVIAGVRKKGLEVARDLGAVEAIDVDDDNALARLRTLDAVADTIGGSLSAKLLGHIKPGGFYGGITGPPQDAALHPTVQINIFRSRPDAKVILQYAEVVRDGKLILPIGREFPLRQAAEAHEAGEKGGVGKIVLLT